MNIFMYYNKDSTNGCTALTDILGKFLLCIVAVRPKSFELFCYRLAYKELEILLRLRPTSVLFSTVDIVFVPVK